MNRFSKKLVSLITVAVVSAGFLGTNTSAYAATQPTNTELGQALDQLKATSEAIGGKYGTNPNGSVGKEKTITIDGSPSDWSEDMIIAQGMANDSPVKFKGDWENCVIDSYAMYAAWDDNNVYVAWQNVNTADVTNGQGAAISDGFLGPLPMVLAIDTGKGNAMTGRMTGGKKLWDSLDITYSTRVDHILAFSANGSGTPGFFTGDANGETNYKTNCGSFKTLGIEYKSSYTCLPKQLLGIKNIPGTPEGVKMLYDDSVKATDLMSGHDTKLDTFYEMKIPLSALGITKDELVKNGIGIMELSTRGESAMDCLPHDPSMLDNVFGSYASEPSNSHEKDDNDNITVPLAKIGKGGQPPIIVKTPTISSLTADKFSPQQKNSTISFDTAASGGTGQLSYQYKVNGTVARDYTSDSKFTWVPAIDGEYTIEVTVKDENGKTTTKTMTYRILTTIVENPLTISNFTTDLLSPQDIGNSIQLNTTTNGGSGTVQTRYSAFDGSKWTMIKEYSTITNATWKPTKAGTYQVWVDVKDSTGKVVSQKSIYVINDNTKPLSISNFTTSAQSPQAIGTTINLASAVEGGTGNVQTRYSVFDGSRWTILKNYSSAMTAAWRPSNAGTYQIWLDAKDSTGKVVSKMVSFTIKKTSPIVINSVIADLTSPQGVGTKINLFTSATSVNSLQYRYWVYDADGNWSALSSFNNSSVVSWTPKKAGINIIWVDVKDDKGNITSKYMPYIVL